MSLEQSLRRVEKLLDETDPAPLRIDFIHGLVTAAGIGPDPTRPNDWLRIILEKEDEPGHPPSPEKAYEVVSALLELYDRNMQALQEGTFSPLFEVVEEGETEKDTVYSAEPFCAGFVTGMRLWDLDWENVDDELMDMVTPLIYLSDPENVENVTGSRDVSVFKEIEENLMESVLVCVYDLYQRHVPAGMVGQSAPFKKKNQVGRNDPCPCGSGKKYKLCCGAN